MVYYLERGHKTFLYNMRCAKRRHLEAIVIFWDVGQEVLRVIAHPKTLISVTDQVVGTIIWQRHYQ